MKRLGSLLTELGWISSEQLEHALQMQEILGGRLGTSLLELGALSEERLQTALAHQADAPAAKARDLRYVPRRVHGLLPARLAQRFQAVPFRMLGNDLHVALLDVEDLDVVQEIAFATGKEIRAFVGNEARLLCALDDHYLLTAPPRVRQLIARLDREDAEQASHQIGSLWTPRRRATRSRETADVNANSDVAAAGRAANDRPGGSRDSIPLVGLQEALSAHEPNDALDPWRRRLDRLDDRDRVARAVLDVLAPHFRRVVLFKLARGVARGWLGTGPGIDTSALRRLHVDLTEPSVLYNLLHGASHHIGPLPPMPAHEEMASAWGGGLPGDCIVLPVKVRGRLVCAILCEPGFSGIDSERRTIGVSGLTEISDTAGHAFERCVLERRRFGGAARAVRSTTAVRLPPSSSVPVGDSGESRSSNR